MTMIVGITGGIGSGKSTFSKVVKKRKLKLLDSDKQVSELYKKPSRDFLKTLDKIGLGDTVKKGKISKKKILNIIFYNQNIKTKLEKYIFKVIRNQREDFIKSEIKRKTKIIFLDIPLLFENNLNKKFDIIVSIISKREERFKRLKKSKKMHKELFNKIVEAQASDIERKRKSDIIIYNNNNLLSYLKKINKTIDHLTK